MNGLTRLVADELWDDIDFRDTQLESIKEKLKLGWSDQDIKNRWFEDIYLNLIDWDDITEDYIIEAKIDLAEENDVRETEESLKGEF